MAQVPYIAWLVQIPFYFLELLVGLVQALVFMDELSPEDKQTVFRARKIQRFLSQPFSSAQVFTGREGRQVEVGDTVRGFKEILDGKHDDVAEDNFYMKHRKIITTSC